MRGGATSGAALMSEHVAIIGAGRVGSSLALALHRAGYKVGLLIDQDYSAAEKAAGVCAAAAGAEYTALRRQQCSLLFLTVPDDAIPAAAGELAVGQVLSPGCLVAHCSGSLPAAVLDALRPQTSRLASFHPLQSFSGQSGDWQRWAGSYLALEGEQEAVDRLEEVARRLQGHPFQLTAAQKPLYHIACVMLSNCLVGLYAAADQLLAGVNLPDEEKRAMTLPLVQNTIANVLKAGPAQALTGPVSRGDAGTIAGHLHALTEHQPGLVELYSALGRHLLKLAEQDGRLSMLQREQLENLFIHCGR